MNFERWVYEFEEDVCTAEMYVRIARVRYKEGWAKARRAFRSEAMAAFGASKLRGQVGPEQRSSRRERCRTMCNGQTKGEAYKGLPRACVLCEVGGGGRVREEIGLRKVVYDYATESRGGQKEKKRTTSLTHARATLFVRR